MKNIFFKALNIFLFFFICFFYLLKYGSRQSYISIEILLAIYAFILAFLIIKNPFNYLNFSSKVFKTIYFVTIFSIALTIFLIIYFTDGNQLKVDRWSAMNVGIEALLNGKYPYTATDHLNGRTSNFPGLFIIGLPFYLLGNVGYLEVFSFLLLSYTLYKCLDIKEALYFILILSFSVSFWYESFAISDLLSNTIIIFCFILFAKKYFYNNYYKYPILLGITTSILALTRGILIIPIILLIFKGFFETSALNKLKFAITFTLISCLLVLMVLYNCPDLYTLQHFNPVNLQTSYLPKWFNYTAILSPFILSFLYKKYNLSYLNLVILLFSILIFTSLFIGLQNFGISNIIFESKFDVSYFNFLLPFLILSLVTNGKLKT